MEKEDVLDEELKEKKKNKKKMILIIVVGLVGLSAGVIGTVIGNVMSNKISSNKQDESVEAKFNDHEKNVSLDEFLVNLSKSKTGEKSYIKIELSLLTSTDKNVEIINSSKDLIRNSIVNTLRQKQAESILNDKNGVDNLKNELKDQINKDYGSALIREVYITNLIIQ